MCCVISPGIPVVGIAPLNPPYLAELQTISSKSDLARAIRYALPRLPRQEAYLSDGRLEIDNNAAERAMHGVALSRKNWLFTGSEGGGKAIAIALTMIETTKLNKVDPQEWLTDVLGRIAEYPVMRVGDLVPWR